MKNQHVGALRKIFSVVFAAMLIAVLSASLSLFAFAQTSGGAPEGTFSSVSFAAESGITQRADERWIKTYDGTSAIDAAHITLTVVGQTAEKKPTDISAVFLSPTMTEEQTDVGEAVIRITYKWEGAEKTKYLPARINAKNLSWKDTALELALTYDPTPGKTEYLHTLTAEELAAASVDRLDGILPADAGKVSVAAIEAVSVGTVEFNEALQQGTSLRKHLKVTLAGDRAVNYTVNNLEANVAPMPIKITEVIWSVDGKTAKDTLTFAYGDLAARKITAVGKVGENAFVDLIVHVSGTEQTPLQADDATYGAVRDEEYVLCAVSANSAYYTLDASHEMKIKFEKAVCEIEVSDIIFSGDAEHTPTFYPISIGNPNGNVPGEVLARIKYSFTLDGKTFADAPDAPGKYTVRFSLDAKDAKNYTLKVSEPGKNTDGVITATVLPYSLNAGFEAGRADVIVFSEKGTLETVSAKLEGFEPASALLKRFTVYKAYKLSLTGVKKGDSFRLVIPVHADLLSDANTHALTDADLYLVNGEEMCVAKDTYKVTMSEDGSYFVIEGVAVTNGSTLSLSMVMAPLYNVSFWATVPGVALIVMLVVLAVLALALIGLKLMRLEKRDVNPVLTVDTEGDAPEVVPVVAPDKLGSADECIDENLDALAGELREDVAPETETMPDASEDANTMATDMMEKTLEEAAALQLGDDSDARAIEEIEKMTEAMAEERAAELSMSVDAGEDGISEDDADLTAAIDEAIGETVNGADDAVETFAAMPVAEDIGETVDSIVVEALAALVEIPDGLLDREAPDSAATGDAHDADARAAATVKEALRALTVDGGALKVRDGCTKASVAKVVSDVAGQYIPEEWSEERAKEVTEAITAALEKEIFH